MSTLIEKLKVKPIPISKEIFKINIAQTKQAVDLKTKIKDKRSISKIDRKELLKRVKPIVEVLVGPISQVPQKPTVIRVAPKKKKLQLKLVGDTAIETAIEDPVEKSPAKPITKPRKLKKKLKLVGISQGTISTIGDPSEKQQLEQQLEQEPKDPKKRRTKKPALTIISEGSEQALVISDVIGVNTLPKEQKKVLVKASSYYLNNRKIFVNFINQLFSQYRAEILEENKTAELAEGIDIVEQKCNRGELTEFSLLLHQKIVRDYLNLFTPYRGLLLYHGLGSGKTCSSIAIAEGMKTSKKIIVMTPASLRRNYIEELKNCGDPLYKKNQSWQFIPVKDSELLLDKLSNVLSLSKDYIRKHDGAWLVNIKKKSNYDQLSTTDKTHLDDQLNEMIRNKYQFINYNGLRNSHLDKFTMDGKINPFDNAVVIIDEAHNFISRIVNKLKKPDALSMRLYEYLMSAQRCRIILLTGTPIINYPNEIGILFNILRGYIKTWKIPLTIKTTEKINETTLTQIIKKTPLLKGLVDFISYQPSLKTLVITRNPFGFVGKIARDKSHTYEGVKLDERGDIDDDDFIKLLSKTLNKHKIEVLTDGIVVQRFKALPDKLDEFQDFFIKSQTGDIKNKQLFQRRILGLASYFRSAQEQLMPRFDIHKDFHVLKIPMSDFQFGVYESARVKERKLETQSARKKKKGAGKDGIYEDSSSTYRIFSRAFCNFVFPRTIPRPLPNDDEDIETAITETSFDEDTLDAATAQERLNNVDGRYLADDIATMEQTEKTDETYEGRIKLALKQLKEFANDFLSKEALEIYSPKFLNMLENIQDKDHVGLHLIYSQFRTLEGIGILKLILEFNGFTQFKIKKNETGLWKLNIQEEDLGKPKFALYTGTEDQEEKEIIRNIYNSDWEFIPTSLKEDLNRLSNTNIMGEIIKVLMITASGAEGISLKNCRYVHITEPYWHPVRIEQVIGRARRICSHKDLPEELRSVKVFLYLMTFSEKQLTEDESIELRLKDKSKIDKKTPLTSDEALYEISNIKNEINKKILTAVKESAFDCALHTTSSSSEPLVCFSFGDVQPDKFAFTPSLMGEEKDTVSKINLKKVTWKAKELTIAGKKYALRQETGDVYDYDSYKQAIKTAGINPILIGKLEKKDGKYKFVQL